MHEISVLNKARADYYETGSSSLSDKEFDQMESDLRSISPENSYFNQVGTTPVDKVKLPVVMGSIDEMKINRTAKWIKNNDNLDEYFLITEKLDGNSVLLVYSDFGSFEAAFTRGDGEFGKDITRHILTTNSIPKSLTKNIVNRYCEKMDDKFFVIGELLIEKKKFDLINDKFYDGKYKNARNFVAGKLNSKQVDENFCKALSLVAFDFKIPNKPADDKNNTINSLRRQGFATPKILIYKGSEISEDSVLTEMFDRFKRDSVFELDGIVLDVNDAGSRSALQKIRADRSSSKNPAYCVKYKISSEKKNKETTVKEVHWEVSKHGLLKPRVEFDKIELSGVSISFASGFNAKFIIENKIGPGAVISVVRSGDVIPFIEAVITPSNETARPDNSLYTFVFDGVDYVTTGQKTTTQRIKEIESFFKSIDVMGFGYPSVEKMFLTSGFETIEDFIIISEHMYEEILGKNGSKIYKSIHEKLNPIKPWVLAGSHPAFAHGVGKRVFEKIYNKTNKDFWLLSADEIEAVPGIGTLINNKIKDGSAVYSEFVKSMEPFLTIEKTNNNNKKPTGDLFSDKYFVFTGFRDAELQQRIEEQGGQVGTSSSKMTHLVCKDLGSNSGKMKAARKKQGVSILTPATVRSIFENR